VDLSPQGPEIEAAKEKANKADLLIVCSYNAWKSVGQLALIQSLIDAGKPLILLILRDPLDEALFSQASMIFTTFSPTVPSIQAVCDELKGRR
jgi:beta-N-acetylhexosaminidase